MARVVTPRGAYWTLAGLRYFTVRVCSLLSLGIAEMKLKMVID